MANPSNDKASNNEHDVEVTSPVVLDVEQKPPIQKVNTFTKICSVLTKWERLYCVIALSFLIIIWSLAMSIIVALKSHSLELVLIYTTSFCIYYIVHGMVSKKPFELMGFVVLIFLLQAYCIINYLSYPNDDLKLASLIFVSIFGPVLIIVGVRFSCRYYLCNVIFHHLVGANAYLQSLCKIMCLCSTLLRFDLHMQISLSILIAYNGSDAAHSEKIVFGITFAFILIGDQSMKYENKILAFLFLIVSISQPIYTIYILSVAKHQFQIHPIQYFALYISGGLGLVTWISSVICMYFVIRNFGKGLKEKVYGATDNKS